MKKIAISVSLNIICLMLFICFPSMLGFIGVRFFIIKLLVFSCLAIPALFLSYKARLDLKKNSFTTNQATSAIVFSVITIIFINALTIIEIQHDRDIKNEVFSGSTQVTIDYICTALKLYKLDCGFYPREQAGLKSLVENQNISCWSGPYILEDIKFSIFQDAWGHKINYKLEGNTAFVSSSGADGSKDTNDDIITNCN